MACCLFIVSAGFGYKVLLAAIRGFMCKKPLSVWMFNIALQRRGCFTAELMLARELIAAGLTVTDACYRSGFQDYSTFSRAYKRQFGTTPRQTR